MKIENPNLLTKNHNNKNMKNKHYLHCSTFKNKDKVENNFPQECDLCNSSI